MINPKERYAGHKENARRRKIPFLLTFRQWWKIWQDSGHWHDRGRLESQFCMARFGDKGAYAIGNVKIITNEQNHKEQVCTDEQRKKLKIARAKHNPCLGKKFSKEARKHMSIAKLGNTNCVGYKHTAEARANMSKSKLGKRHTKEAKAKMSDAKLKYWANLKAGL